MSIEPQVTPPAGLEYGRVNMRVVLAVADGADDDHRPDLVPPDAVVVFQPPKHMVRSTTPDTDGLTVTVSMAPIRATFDDEGYLTVRDGQRGVDLVASTGLLDPDPWVYTVKFEKFGTYVAPFPLYVEGGAEIDLTLERPTSGAGQISTVTSVAARVAAEGAAHQAVAAAEAAVEVADDVERAAETAATSAGEARAASTVASGAAEAAVSAAGAATSAAAVAESLTVQRVEDAVSEWWIHPRTIDDPTRARIVGGDVSADTGDGTSRILVWERTDAGTVRRYAIASTPTDDHNVPAVLRLPWGGLLVAWSNHNRDTLWRWKISNRDGDLVSLVTAPEQTHNTGFDISYAQLHLIEHLSTEASATVWALVRLYRGDGWAWEFLTMTIAPDGTTTVSAPRRFLTGGTHQAYAISCGARTVGEQVIRVAFGYNPAADRSTIHAFDVNTVTGEVTSPTDSTRRANVTTPVGVPINPTQWAPLLPEPAEGRTRRLYYPRPGPASWGVAYSEWDTIAPDEAAYRFIEATGGEAGARIVDGTLQTAIPGPDPTTGGYTLALVGLRLGVPSIPGDREIARRWISASDRQLQVRITPDGRLKVNLTRAGNAAADYVTTAPIPGIFTETITLILQVVPSAAGGTLTVRAGGTPEDAVQVGDVIPIGAQATLQASTAPLVIGTTATALRIPLTLGGAVLALHGQETPYRGIVLTDAPEGLSSLPGLVGDTWDLTGSASIVRPWATHDLGIAGPRVGYTPTANYNGGVAFPEPCHPDSAILVARRDDGSSTLERWARTPAGGIALAETVATSTDYIARPDSPVGGARGIRALWTEFTAYGAEEYATYEGRRRID